MSPDNEALSRAEQVRRRREEESKMRVTTTKTRVGGGRKETSLSKKPAVRKPTERPVLTRSPMRTSTARRSSFGDSTRRYDAAYSMPIARGAAKPAMVPMELGNRVVSGGLALLCLVLVVWMLGMPPFIFTSVQLVGAQRVSPLEVNAATGLVGRSILFARPEEIEASVRAAFPEFEDVKVSVNLPDYVTLTVRERTPLVAWQYQDRLTWIDAQGVGFVPRGSADNVVPVMAFGMPQTQVINFDPLNLDQATSLFIAPETVLAIQSLQPYVPAGAMLIFKPEYGLGWDDPRGWQVFFGVTGRDIPLKLQIYQTIVDTLLQRGITPTLISVEYPDAPFYRTEP